jgi:hypothetical protein
MTAPKKPYTILVSPSGFSPAACDVDADDQIVLQSIVNGAPVQVYAFQGNQRIKAFTSPEPYFASSAGETYLLAIAKCTITLSLTDSSPAAPAAPHAVEHGKKVVVNVNGSNGTINVG